MANSITQPTPAPATQQPELPKDTASAAMRKRTDTFVDIISSRVSSLLQEGKLHLPANYSAQNALKSLWLILQRTKDKNDKYVLDVCTPASVMNTMLDTVLQGLDPEKKQMYPIAYGTELTCQRSYHGSVAVARRVRADIDDVIAAPVYEGDKFTYALKNGGYQVVEHEQQLQNVDKKKIVAAYAIAVNASGQPLRTEIMTIEQIHSAWRKSKANPFNSDGSVRSDRFHGEFPDEACRKTVINRLCKRFINTSDDASLVMESFMRTGDEVEETVDREANSRILEMQAASHDAEQAAADNRAKADQSAAGHEDPSPAAENGPGY